MEYSEINNIDEIKNQLWLMVKDYTVVGKWYNSILFQYSKALLNSGTLSAKEKSRIYGLELAAYYNDYEFEKAEKVAGLLEQCSEIHSLAYCTLAEYYGRTRRYAKCKEVLDQAMSHYPLDDLYHPYVEKNERRMDYASNHQYGEYLPNPSRNRKEMMKKYLDFIKSLGIEPTKIYHKEHYVPDIHHRYDADFDTFVAFDFETTGLSYITNSPIEIGAIKVIHGKIIESKEYIFQELMKPREGSVSDFITELTGITNEDLKDAREMKEVMSDFFEWAGDLPIIGYNSRAFDTYFLSVCAKECNHVINNEHFDVIIYARNHLCLGNYRLTTVADSLGIVNPRAHRALGDAITTAKVFMTMKSILN